MEQPKPPCKYCGEPNLRTDPRAIFCSVRCKEKDRDKRRRAMVEYKAAKAQYHHDYHLRTRDRQLRNSAAWREANRERHRMVSREWARQHKHASPRSWRSDHLPQAAAKERLRTRRIREATPFPLEHDLVVQKIAYWGGKCWICRAPFQAIDHVKPIARGGLNILANLRPICTTCNSRKRDRWAGPRTLALLLR